MKSWRLRALVTTAALVALPIAAPAEAGPAASPALQISAIAFDRAPASP